eukprot:PhF_6_TR35414/c0_g1_i1/m.51545
MIQLERRGSTMPPKVLADLRQEIADLEGTVTEVRGAFSDVSSPVMSPRSPKILSTHFVLKPRDVLADSECGSTDIGQELLRSPVDVPYVKKLAQTRSLALNMPSSLGLTAMHVICTQVRDFSTQHDLMMWFLRFGGNLGMCDKSGKTPLELLDTVDPGGEMRMNVHRTLLHYQRSICAEHLQHVPLDITAEVLIEPGPSATVSKAFHPSISGDGAAVYAHVHPGVLRLVHSSTNEVYCTVMDPWRGEQIVVSPYSSIQGDHRKFPHHDSGNVREDTFEFIWGNDGSLAIVNVGDGRGTVIKQCASSYLQYCISENYRRGSKLAACVLSGAGIFALVKKEGNTHVFTVFVPRKEVLSGSSAEVIKVLMDNIDNEVWRTRSLTTVTFWLPETQVPSCVAYVGAGNVVLLCSSGPSYAYNYEKAAITEITVLPSSSSEKSLFCCGFASKELMERFEFVDASKALSVVCVVSERSVGFYRLSLSDVPRHGKQITPTRLIMKFSNNLTGGAFTACYHPTENLFLLVRAATGVTECTMVDVANSSNRIMCSLYRYPKRENSLFHIIPKVSLHGTTVYRQNLDDHVVIGSSWAQMKAMSKTEISWCVSATSSVLSQHLALRIPAPAGQVSLVFTDLQSSTALWDGLPHMETYVTRHFMVMRRLMMRFRGYEVKTEGDAFMVCFQDPVDALNWCLAAQLIHLCIEYGEDILQHDPCQPIENKRHEVDEDTLFYYSDTLTLVDGYVNDDEIPMTEDVFRWLWRGLRIRMGIHTCTPLLHFDPTSQRMDYMGPTVNLSARVASSGFGGEIVISKETYEWLGLASGERVGTRARAIVPVTIEDIGTFNLKGIREPKTLYHILPTILAERFDTFNETREAAGSPRPGSRATTERAPSFMVAHSPLTAKSRVHFESPRGDYQSSEADSEINHQSNYNKHVVQLKEACSLCTEEFLTADSRFCHKCGSRRGMVLP